MINDNQLSRLTSIKLFLSAAVMLHKFAPAFSFLLDRASSILFSPSLVHLARQLAGWLSVPFLSLPLSFFPLSFSLFPLSFFPYGSSKFLPVSEEREAKVGEFPANVEGRRRCCCCFLHSSAR